jgi:hypothetical protein
MMLSDAPIDPPLTECLCPADGDSRPVLVAISGGYVCAVVCAICKLPHADLEWAEISADLFPMTVTFHVEQRPGGWNPEGPGPVPDEQLVAMLTLREGGEAA